VLVENDNKRRINWKLGIIKKLIKSHDSHIRAAIVEFNYENRKVVIKRPINKLYPIEYDKRNKNEIKITFIDDHIPKQIVDN